MTAPPDFSSLYYPTAILFKHPENQVCCALFDAQYRLQMLIQNAPIGDISSRYGAIYRAKVTSKASGKTQKAFIALPANQQGLLNKAASVHEGEWLTLQIAREAFQDKQVELSPALRLENRYFTLKLDKNAPNLNFKDSAKWMEASSLEITNQAIKGELIFKPMVMGLTTDQASFFAQKLIDEAERLNAYMDGKLCQLRPAPDYLEQTCNRLKYNANIYVTSLDLFSEVKSKLEPIAPDLLPNCQFIGKKDPLSLKKLVMNAIEEVAETTLTLDHGVRLSIETTKAATLIDLDQASTLTTHAGGEMNLNLETVPEIARQIRLRQLGGIILIDPLRPEQTGRKKIRIVNNFVHALRQEFKYDRVKTDILGVTRSGLVELVRQRILTPLNQ